MDTVGYIVLAMLGALGVSSLLIAVLAGRVRSPEDRARRDAAMQDELAAWS